MDVSIDKAHSMQTLKHLTIIAISTLIAGLVSLFLMGSPTAVLMEKVAITISVIGLATILTLYFWKEVTTALTFREEDSRWH